MRYKILKPRKLVKAIRADDRVVSMASVLSVAHDYAVETTLAELSDGSHMRRIEGDLVDVTALEWHAITAPPVNIADCLSWAVDNRVKRLNTRSSMCRVSRLVLADRRRIRKIEFNRVQMGNSPVEQLAQFILSLPGPEVTTPE